MIVEGDTKERLLAAAQAVYLEGGFATFSLREVARRVGVSAAAVYRHYPSKEALLEAVCAQGFQVFGSYLVRALGEATPLERLRASSRMYLAFATEHPQAYRVIFLGAAEGFMPSSPTTGHIDASTFQFLVDRVSECVKARVLAKGDALETATMIWAHVHGLSALRITGHFMRLGTDEEFARFYEQAVDRFLAGLAPAR
jgi:AcrR family transcriptional regulator